MSSSVLLRRVFPSLVQGSAARALFAGSRQFSISASALKDDSPNKINGQIPTVVHQPEKDEPWIPPFIENFNEPIDEKRSRLLYQSRKRGMLENGLLLGSFAKKHLADFNSEQLTHYDRLINLPSNDWDIYNWAIGHKETPEEFDNQVMDLLKQHAKNEDRESRIRMPDLY